MIYMGIDPGRKGSIAVLFEDGSAVVEMLSKSALQSWCKTLRDYNVHCYLEQVHSMPKQGVRSTFTFGMEYGYIKGVLDSFSTPYREVAPEIWKREYCLSKDKKESIKLCKELFPDVSLKPTKLYRVDSDGMAEALLLAEYARRKWA